MGNWRALTTRPWLIRGRHALFSSTSCIATSTTTTQRRCPCWPTAITRHCKPLRCFSAAHTASSHLNTT
eukprot:2008524-Pleurochrysis_carterae.AAC.1